MRLLLLLLLVPGWLSAGFFRLEGHLDEAAVSGVSVEGDVVALEVASTSGDLKAVLGLAKKLYAAKAKVVVYIDGEAVGPAAILPFAADELMTSLVVSWGDIPAGNAGYPTNLLLSQVRSFGGSELMRRLAEAMIDPAKASFKWQGTEIVTPEGQAAVLNQNELLQLGVVAAVVTVAEFREELGFETVPETEDIAIAPTTVEEELAKHIKYLPMGPNVVGHIKLGREGISRSTFLYVKNAVDYYKELRPAFVILELNSPGGEVFAAEQISELLVDLDVNSGIPVVAFINNWAMSAGALEAYSARFIAITKDAAMGAAEPVLSSQSGEMQSASEKINSALRADFANRAAFYDRNPLLAEAMVDKDVILVERHDQIIKLDTEDQIQKIGPNPDKVISAKGKLLTLNAQQLMDLGVADIRVPVTAIADITEAEAADGKWPAEKSPLFAYPFFKAIPNATIDAYQMDWRVQFFSILTNPMVSSFLFLAMLLGFYIEFNTPGFGIPGTVGLVALFLIVLSSYALQAAGWLEVIILSAGFLLIGLELFVIPGFGIAGIAGIILALIGIVLMMLPAIQDVGFTYDTGDLNAAGEVFIQRLAYIGGAIIVGAIVMGLLSKFVLPKFSRFSRLVLRTDQSGYVAGPDVESLPPVGTRGVAVTPFRPSGKIRVGEEVFEASSAGGFISRGTELEVISHVGSRIVVEPIG